MTFSPDSSIKSLELSLPGNFEAGEHRLKLRFSVRKGNILFDNGKSILERSILIRVDPAPIPSASLVSPELPAGQKLRKTADWSSEEVKSNFDIEVDFSAESKRRSIELKVVDENSAVLGTLTQLKSRISIPSLSY